MTKDFINEKGVVLSVLPGSSFKVKIISNNQIIDAFIAGKLKFRRKKKVVEGDNVYLEISPYDLKKGRIVGIVYKQ